MNFKTLIRLAKQAHNKLSFTVSGYEVVMADGYIMGWQPTSEHGAWDVDGKPVDPPSEGQKLATATLIKHYSPPLEEMIKVNSNYLRRMISAIETKGNEPIYLKLDGKYIALAYPTEEGVSRGLIACMRNE